MKRNVATFVLVLALAATNGLAQEPVGTAFTYQGQLNQNGVPVTGTADFIFSLWDAQTGGNQIGMYFESPSDYPVVDGLFTIELDFNPPEEWIYDGTALWMEVSVDYPSGSGQWETLAPRQHLTATPFASFSTLATAVPWAGILDIPAGFADGVDDVGDGAFWSLTGNADTIPGTHYLGTSDDTPLELYVDGARALRIEPTGDYPNIIAGYFTNNAAPDTIAATIAGGAYNQIEGWHATIGGGIGNEVGSSYNATIAGGDNNLIGDVAGWAAIGGGRNNEATQEYAVIPGGRENLAGGEYSFAAGYQAKVRDPNAVGDGDTNGDEGTFVWADSTGGEFWSTGPDQFLIRAAGGVAIGTNTPHPTATLTVDDPSRTYGIRATGSTIGIRGAVTPSGSATYTGVMGYVTGGTGTNYGVYGEAVGDGVDYDENIYGGYFVTEGNRDSAAVAGLNASSSNYDAEGYLGYVESGEFPLVTGVLGVEPTSGNGYAGYFRGSVRVTGELSVDGNVSKGGGSFKIDHPLDPENKYLYHSFVESPEMMNVYNGNVVLDADGEAVVELPEWFEALNGDYRYQLTCIGGFAQVYIADEIAGNTFRIAGGRPGLKVSWQVTGVRQDAWANANRIPVEVDKPEHERGTYLHPEAHGVPAELGESYRTRQGIAGPPDCVDARAEVVE
jgi:hypothetical protein